MRQRLQLFATAITTVATVLLVMTSIRGQTEVNPNPTQDQSTFEHGLVTKGADVVPGTRTDPAPPDLPWGDPNLQGTWAGMTTTPLERPDPGETVITDPELIDALYDEPPERGDTGTYNAAWAETGLPSPGRTELIVDPPNGKLPALTPEGQRMADAPERVNARARATAAENPEDLRLRDRCLNWETMIDGRGRNRWYRVVQTPGWVAINSYRLHDMRLIPLDGRPHLPQDIRPWMGDSRGHWEGKTLVVETTNYNGRNESVPGIKTKNLRLVERFTRVDVDTLNYEATVHDPAVWTKPWTILNPMVLDVAGFYEYGCHEGNHSMTAILNGARVKEKESAQ